MRGTRSGRTSLRNSSRNTSSLIALAERVDDQRHRLGSAFDDRKRSRDYFDGGVRAEVRPYPRRSAVASGLWLARDGVGSATFQPNAHSPVITDGRPA